MKVGGCSERFSTCLSAVKMCSTTDPISMVEDPGKHGRESRFSFMFSSRTIHLYQRLWITTFTFSSQCILEKIITYRRILHIVEAIPSSSYRSAENARRSCSDSDRRSRILFATFSPLMLISFVHNAQVYTLVFATIEFIRSLE